MQHAPLPTTMNALGDAILHHDESSSSSSSSNNDFQFNEMEDNDASASIVAHQSPIRDIEIQSPPADGMVMMMNDPCAIHPKESFNVPAAYYDKDIPQLRIMKLVRKYGAPLKMVGEFSKILKEEQQRNRLDITMLTTHATGIRRLQKMYSSLPSPVPITISHERTIQEMNSGSNRPSLTFPVFSFLGQLKDLLNDHVFSDIQNLVVDPSNRWDHYKKNSCPHATEELQDGLWFQSIVDNIQSNPSPPGIKDFIFGIQGYVDKTGTDAYQRRAVEPFVFTLTLFSNRIRNSSKYWRVLALLPASTSQKQKKKYVFGASVRNYHVALRAALQEFIHLQHNPPIVRLRIGDQFLMVRARLFWINTIADGLANDQLVGRIQNRTTSPRLSRGCHCPQHMADDCLHHCKFLRQSSIESLVVAALGPSPESPEWDAYLNSLGTNQTRKAAESSLQIRKRIARSILKEVFGQHVVDLVWFHIDQGPNPRGCFGSTPVDPMHAFEEGIVPNILSVILDPLQDSAKSNLDALALNIAKSNRWDKDYPRMNFSGGFSSLTQLTADEKVGKMLLLWILMQTTLGRDIMNKRCNPAFDTQRISAAARFSGGAKCPSTDDSEETEETEEDESTSGVTSSKKYVGTPAQLEMVDRWLHEYRLQFVVPWLIEMSPYHQEELRKTVYNTCFPKGKSGKFVLPEEKFLDRHEVTMVSTKLYCNEDGMVLGNQSPQQVVLYKHGKSAEHSLDCSIEELQKLLEMLLAFHANYKYGVGSDKINFDANVRFMMSMVKGIVRRGNDTKNWSISKFHELLHFHIDHQNFGSLANIDAGKGEQGLKLWAKLPSKNVRAREACQYYMDLAQRIYENRLLELASDTLFPLASTTTGTNNTVQQEQGLEVDLTIKLTQPLLCLNKVGETSLQEDLSLFLRRQTSIRFPVEVFQEATYSRGEEPVRTVRASPSYRSTGPWFDWVLVCYQIGTEEVFYPCQVFGFFENNIGKKIAVGQLGQRIKSQKCCLLDHWTLESQFRLIDMETIWQICFAISIPSSPNTGGGQTTKEVLVIKDRIQDWPTLFATHKWGNTQPITKHKKRKHQN